MVKLHDSQQHKTVKRAKKGYALTSDIVLSEYLGLVGDAAYRLSCSELLQLLLDSGHSVDIDDSDEQQNRVQVGKHGLTLSGKGESLRGALINAALSFIYFLRNTGHIDSSQPQRSRSAMPFHTALSWMIEGHAVRRQIWVKPQSIKLKQGFLPKDSETLYGRVLGVPVEYYRQTQSGNQLGLYIDPKFITVVDETEMPWEPSTIAVLASDWELA